MTYNHKFYFHDKKNNVVNCEIEIYDINGYDEFHIRCDDYERDIEYTDTQKALLKLEEQYKNNREIDIDSLMIELEYHINSINEEDDERLEQYTWGDYFSMVQSDTLPEELHDLDDKVIALAIHLDISPLEAVDDITVSSYDNNIYCFGKQDYYVFTDSEADDAERIAVENVIEDCYLSELSRGNKNHPALDYIDMDRWIDDLCGHRGNNLAGYDGSEHEINVNKTWYYVYRIN